MRARIRVHIRVGVPVSSCMMRMHTGVGGVRGVWVSRMLHHLLGGRPVKVRCHGHLMWVVCMGRRGVRMTVEVLLVMLWMVRYVLLLSVVVVVVVGG